MFSVTYTGMNFLPLCTAIVCPTISGIIVERRDHVRSTFFSLRAFMAPTFVARCASTNGPFLVERAINYPFLRRFTINASVRLLFRVLYPRVGWPHGVTGWRPPEVLPSPPPCGWSTGFIETPRLEGRIPFQRLRPALQTVTLSWSVVPTW